MSQWDTCLLLQQICSFWNSNSLCFTQFLLLPHKFIVTHIYFHVSKIYANVHYKEFLVLSAFLTDPTLHMISFVKDCLNLMLNVV